MFAIFAKSEIIFSKKLESLKTFVFFAHRVGLHNFRSFTILLVLSKNNNFRFYLFFGFACNAIPHQF
jgi:hypothetical protein